MITFLKALLEAILYALKALNNFIHENTDGWNEGPEKFWKMAFFWSMMLSGIYLTFVWVFGAAAWYIYAVNIFVVPSYFAYSVFSAGTGFTIGLFVILAKITSS